MEIIFHFGKKKIACLGISEMTTNLNNIVVTARSSIMSLVVTSAAIPVTVPMNHGKKTEMFKGLNFKR